jgi:hypothetical protein
LDARITLFNDKLVSKINDDHWREVLSQCIPEGMDDIQSGDEHGDMLMLDYIAGDILILRVRGSINNHLKYPALNDPLTR